VEFSLYIVAGLLYCVHIISVMRAPFQKHDVIVWVGLQEFKMASRADEEAKGGGSAKLSKFNCSSSLFWVRSFVSVLISFD